MKDSLKLIFSTKFWIDLGTGLDRLLESVSLLTVSLFTGYGALHYVANPLQQKLLLGAAGVIGLRGAWEFVKFVASRKAE